MAKKVISVKSYSVTQDQYKRGVYFKECRKHGQELQLPFFDIKTKDALLTQIAKAVVYSADKLNIYVYVVRVQNSTRAAVLVTETRMRIKEYGK